MVKTTKAQRKALKAIYDRGPIYPYMTDAERDAGFTAVAITYRQFRRGVAGTFSMDGCIMIPWCGMWLGIERDGYTHS